MKNRYFISLRNLFENFFRMFAEIARRKIVEFGPDRLSKVTLKV
jgi:hypothetical protein